MNKRNRQQIYNTRIRNLTTLGSKGTSCTVSVRKSFDEEHKSIRKEMRRLGVV